MDADRSPAQVLGTSDPEDLGAEDLIRAVIGTFGRDCVLACSFQKEETVLLDMLFAADPGARVFALDTNVLFDETYEYWRQVENRYSTTIEVFEGPTLDEQAAAEGPNLWERDQNRCCALRKVEPLTRALATRKAWITGIRRDQSPTRAQTRQFHWDSTHGLWKANPLAAWDDERCWDYIRERDLPTNPLHDRGYASIGCIWCTMPGDGREGRWSGSDKTECGLHVEPAG